MSKHFNTNHVPFSEETWLWIKDKIESVIHMGKACEKTIYGDYIVPEDFDKYYQEHRHLD